MSSPASALDPAPYPVAPEEPARLAALREYQLLERDAERAFDDLAALAAEACGTRMGCVSFVDDRTVRVTASHGLGALGSGRLAREHAFCAHAAFASDVFVVPDATRDARFRASPLVTGRTAVRFYAGVPVLTPQGHRLGALGVLDTEPRELQPRQISLLRRLSGQAAALLQARLAALQLRAAMAERDAHEVALRESEARFRRLADATTDGIAISEGGRIIAVNDSFCRMFRTRESDAMGRHPMEFVAPESRADVGRRVATRFEGLYEAAGIRPDGTTFPIEVSSREIDFERRTSRVALVRDVSERREVDRLKSEFVSVVSHELRTPLTSIRGSLGLLEGGAVGVLPPRAAELTRIARVNADRVIRLVSDILDLEKMAAGKLELRLATLDPAGVIAAAVEGADGMAAQRGVRLRAETQGTAPCLRGDFDRLVQVLTNLLSNAIKFSPEGGEVVVRASAAPAGVRLAVVDRGPGIPPHLIGKLFQRFGQLDASDTRPQNGSGLGLVISRSIVEQHGGTMGVESTPGVRTTFWMELPAAPAGA